MLRVFLSYHTPDRTPALSLKRAIEDTLRGADVFVDQTHLRYGHLWQPSLFDAIAKAQAFLILISHRAGDWHWPETLKDSRAWAYLAMKPGDRRAYVRVLRIVVSRPDRSEARRSPPGMGRAIAQRKGAARRRHQSER